MKLHGGPKEKSKNCCSDTDIQVDGLANPKGGASRQEQVAHGAAPDGRDGGDQDHPQKIHAPFRGINGARESKDTGTKQIQKFQETVGELYYLPVMLASSSSSSNLQGVGWWRAQAPSLLMLAMRKVDSYRRSVHKTARPPWMPRRVDSHGEERWNKK